MERKGGEERGEVGGEGGFEVEQGAGERVGQGEAPGVEHLPRGAEGQGSVEGGGAVDGVAGHRTADRGHVDADLVRPAGVDADARQRRGAEVLRDLVVRRRGLSAARDDRHPLPVGGGAADVRLEMPGGRFRHAGKDREVGLADLARAEGGGETLERGVRLGDDDRAAGVAVEAMDDARPPFAADVEDAGAAVEDGVDEGAVGVAGGGVDDEARGLVDDEDRVVLEEHGEGDVLGDERHGRGGLGAQDVGLAGRDPAPGLGGGGPAGAGDLPRAKVLLHAGAGDSGDGGEPGVEPRGRRAVRHGEGARRGAGHVVVLVLGGDHGAGTFRHRRPHGRRSNVSENSARSASRVTGLRIMLSNPFAA